MGGTATDGSCAMVGGVSRSVPSSPGERSDKFGQNDGSQGGLEGATEIRFQNKPARGRIGCLHQLRTRDAVEVSVPQISVWTHIDSEGAGGVWTGPGPADTDTGVWSSDPDSNAQVSSPTPGRQLSLDSPPGYQPSQYYRHPYQTVPSQATPSPPDSSFCNSFSAPLARPSQALSIAKVTSPHAKSGQTSEQQSSLDDSRYYPQQSSTDDSRCYPQLPRDDSHCYPQQSSTDDSRIFPSDKEDNEPHVCRCRSNEPLKVTWTSRTSLKTSPSPRADSFPPGDSSPPNLSPGSSTNVDLLPSVRTVNQQEQLPSPGSAPWHQAAAAGCTTDSDSKNYCKKTLP